MVDSYARDAAEFQEPPRFDADCSIENKVVLANKDGNTESKRTDRACHLPHMSRVIIADFSPRQAQLFQRDIDNFEGRRQIVAPRSRRCRQCGQPRKVVTATAALHL